MEENFNPLDELNNCHACVIACTDILSDPVFKIEDNESMLEIDVFLSLLINNRNKNES